GAGQDAGRQGPLHPVGDGVDHDGTGRAAGSGGVRMIRTKAQKQELVTTLAARLGRSSTVYVTDFTGLSVAKLTQLRRRLRQAGTEFVVVKNTLARRALADAHPAGDGGGLELHLERP